MFGNVVGNRFEPTGDVSERGSILVYLGEPVNARGGFPGVQAVI